MTSRSEVAESALCAAETTPYRTMNLYPDALFICRQGRIVFANAACMRLLGANCPEQILGRSPLDFVHRDHKPRVEQRIVERMATGSPSPLIEEKLVRVDGETVDVEVAVLPYQAQDQTVLHVLLRDVAMRKEAERELKDSEEQFRNLFEESPLGLCMISLDLHIRRANARLGTMLGYSGREMVDRTIDTFVHPEDVPAGIECLRCLIYGEIPRCTFEMRFLTRSEQIVWGRLHVSMVRDSKQASRYALAMIEDITERKHAEQTQCEEHQRFENMVATSPGALYSLRLRPDGTSSLPYVSPRLSELYGLQSEPVQEDASALFALIHPDDLPEVQAAIAASAQTMDPCRNEHRILHPKMGMRWIEIYSMPEREADGSVQWHGIAVDITDRKQGEEILRKNQEHLRIAIDAAKLGLWECDLKTEKLIWSGHCEKLFGMLPGEFDGTYQTFLQRIHPDDRSDLVASRENARKTGAAYAHVYRVVWPDGTIHWLSGVGHFLYDDTGEATHAAGAMIDVTERQRLQEERVQMLAVAERRAVTLAMARRVALDILVNRTGTEALKHIAEAARTLAQARYAALGVADSTGERLQDFITAGLTSEEESAIGTLPDGRGVLGLLLTSAEPLRIDTLAEHPASVGFPPAHPLMESFLGVPIRSDDRVLGSLYLTNGAGGAPFTDADEAAIAALADYAAVAIHFQHLLHQQSLLTHSFINTLEEERRSVSYELHDGLTQYVMVAHAFLSSYASQYRKQFQTPMPEKLEKGLEYVRQAMVEARRMVNGLRSLALDDLGLAGALERLVTEEKQRANWEEIEIQHNLSEQRFAIPLETAVYRVAQEALTNARKYAEASRMRVMLFRKGEPLSAAAFLVLEVRDWGKGFDIEKTRASYEHLGMHSMEERVRLMKGSFEIVSTPGEGTLVRAVFPLRDHETIPSPL